MLTLADGRLMAGSAYFTVQIDFLSGRIAAYVNLLALNLATVFLPGAILCAKLFKPRSIAKFFAALPLH